MSNSCRCSVCSIRDCPGEITDCVFSFHRLVQGLFPDRQLSFCLSPPLDEGIPTDGFASSNTGVHEDDFFSESHAQATEGLFAHAGSVDSVSEDTEDNLIAAEDWLEVVQALGISCGVKSAT